MKKIICFLLTIFTLTLISQTECYSSLNYSKLNPNSSDFIKKNGEIGICFNRYFVSILIEDKIILFPVSEISISKRRGSNGYLVYSFMTDKTNLYPIAYWSIEIVYGKNRQIYINNTMGGQVYLIEFKTNKYHYLEEKIISNIDSLNLEKKRIYDENHKISPEFSIYLKSEAKKDSIRNSKNPYVIKERRKKEINDSLMNLISISNNSE